MSEPEPRIPKPGMTNAIFVIGSLLPLPLSVLWSILFHAVWPIEGGEATSLQTGAGIGSFVAALYLLYFHTSFLRRIEAALMRAPVLWMDFMLLLAGNGERRANAIWIGCALIVPAFFVWSILVPWRSAPIRALSEVRAVAQEMESAAVGVELSADHRAVRVGITPTPNPFSSLTRQRGLSAPAAVFEYPLAPTGKVALRDRVRGDYAALERGETPATLVALGERARLEQGPHFLVVSQMASLTVEGAFGVHPVSLFTRFLCASTVFVYLLQLLARETAFDRASMALMAAPIPVSLSLFPLLWIDLVTAAT